MTRVYAQASGARVSQGRVVCYEWEGHSVTVVSRAGLIDLKKLRGSPQDMAVIALLESHA